MTSLVPLPIDTDLIEQSVDPAAFIVLACERAKTWLAQALEHGEIDQIVEFKSQAEAIRVYTVQKQLGKDAELSAAEIVRRAERGIGVAIRRGQEAGTIMKRGDNIHTHKEDVVTNDILRPRPVVDVCTRAELYGSGESPGIYDLADNGTDDDFEQAVEEAKAEKNLSRANVVRKIKGEAPKPNGRHELLRKKRHLDPNRIVNETTVALEGLALGVGLVEVADLDPQRVYGWATSLSDSLRSLNRLAKQLKEMTRDTE